MPIRITCRCGQSLSVPDAMAGKSGKCPKCSESIRIPTPVSNAPAAPATAGKAISQGQKKVKPVEAKPAQSGALDQLFADAGLEKKKGPECPSCKAPIDANAAMCVKCGFNLTTGQKVKGVAAEALVEVGRFSNRQLNDADKSLKKESEADEKAKYTGAPWWVSLAVILGLMTIIVFGVIMVEGLGPDENEDGLSLKAPETTLRGKIQRLPLPNALLFVGSIVSIMVVVMAWIATCATAFRDKIGQGFLCLIPPYPHYYSFAHRKTMGSTMWILWGWTVVLIALAIGLTTTGTLKFMMK